MVSLIVSASSFNRVMMRIPTGLREALEWLRAACIAEYTQVPWVFPVPVGGCRMRHGDWTPLAVSMIEI
jgi:hypothetical protein